MGGEDERRKRRWGASGVFVPACLLIGMGVGFLTDRLTAGLLVGLGAGLFLMAVAHLVIETRDAGTGATSESGE